MCENQWKGQDLLALFQSATDEIRQYKNMQLIYTNYGILLYVVVIGLFDYLDYPLLTLFFKFAPFLIAILGSWYILNFQKTMKEKREILKRVYGKFSKEFNDCNGKIPKNYTSRGYYLFSFAMPLILILWVGAVFTNSIVNSKLEKAYVEQQSKYLKVERILNDFIGYTMKVGNEHREQIESIANDCNIKRKLESGHCVRKIYEALEKNQRLVATRWLEGEREIQDLLVSLGEPEIKDTMILQKFNNIKGLKNYILNALDYITESWLEKRNWLIGKEEARIIKNKVIIKLQ